MNFYSNYQVFRWQDTETIIANISITGRLINNACSFSVQSIHNVTFYMVPHRPSGTMDVKAFIQTKGRQLETIYIISVFQTFSEDFSLLFSYSNEKAMILLNGRTVVDDCMPEPNSSIHVFGDVIDIKIVTVPLVISSTDAPDTTNELETTRAFSLHNSESTLSSSTLNWSNIPPDNMSVSDLGIETEFSNDLYFYILTLVVVILVTIFLCIFLRLRCQTRSKIVPHSGIEMRLINRDKGIYTSVINIV